MTTKERLVKTLWLPLVWMLLVFLDLVIFSSGKPESLVAQTFESFVFMMSFLFYPIQWGLRDVSTSSRLILSASAQFLFWWLVALAISWALDLLKRKKTTN